MHCNYRKLKFFLQIFYLQFCLSKSYRIFYLTIYFYEHVYHRTLQNWFIYIRMCRCEKWDPSLFLNKHVSWSYPHFSNYLLLEVIFHDFNTNCSLHFGITVLFLKLHIRLFVFLVISSDLLKWFSAVSSCFLHPLL